MYNKTTENTGANIQQNAAIGDNGRRFCVQGETRPNVDQLRTLLDILSIGDRIESLQNI